MFEKEADSYARGCLMPLDWKQFDIHDKVVLHSAFKDGAEFGYNKAKEEMQEQLKADLIAKLKEQMQYSTSPSCMKGMELFIRSIEKWEIKERN